MATYLRLAWRNIWRNKRRTIITASSIAFALLFSLCMRAMQIGSYQRMIDNLVQTYTGYIQIHAKGYWDEKTLDNTMVQDSSVTNNIAAIPYVKAIIPRLESFALASEGQKTKGVAVCGIVPDAETELTKLSMKIVKGNYLDEMDSGVLVAEGLANYLKLNVNDTFVIIGQGYHGVSAAGKFPIRGIVSFPTPELNNQMVYMTLKNAQDFYSAENRVTSLAINLKNRDDIQQTEKQLGSFLPADKYEVMPWQVMLKEMVQYIKLDQSSGFIMLGILYFVVAFGILGTLMMMISERTREFGMMIAVGMQRIKIAFVVLIEMIYLALIGTISGILISLPVIVYFLYHPVRLTGDMAKMMINYGMEPVMPVAFEPGYFIGQSLIVLIIVAVVLIYPLSRILHINLINSLRR